MSLVYFKIINIQCHQQYGAECMQICIINVLIHHLIFGLTKFH